MNRSPSFCAASVVALALLTFGPASHASTLSGVAPSSVVGIGAEAVGALASRALDPSLQSASLAGSGITDATVTPPSAVPEPESIGLLGLGLAAMLVATRRRARRRSSSQLQRSGCPQSSNGSPT